MHPVTDKPSQEKKRRAGPMLPRSPTMAAVNTPELIDMGKIHTTIIAGPLNMRGSANHGAASTVESQMIQAIFMILSVPDN